MGYEASTVMSLGHYQLFCDITSDKNISNYVHITTKKTHFQWTSSSGNITWQRKTIQLHVYPDAFNTSHRL